MEILENLEPLLRTFWYIAIPVSLFFIIQTIMIFVGADSSDAADLDFDADFDTDLGETEAPFQLFSIRNLVNFLLGFSWMGISFYSTITNKYLLILASLAVGMLFVYVFFLVVMQVQKLAEDNSFKFTDTLDKTAEVYLAIPENKTGKGKITLSVNGSYRELDAITENDKIPTGEKVKIVDIINKNTLVVETIKSNEL